MKSHAIACVGGLELGAVPIVSAVAASHLKGSPVDAFFVRTAQREHGAREEIDGDLRGAEVLMIDDG